MPEPLSVTVVPPKWPAPAMAGFCTPRIAATTASLGSQSILENGRLTPRSWTQSQGKTPRFFALDLAERFLLAAMRTVTASFPSGPMRKAALLRPRALPFTAAARSASYLPRSGARRDRLAPCELPKQR